MVPNPAREAPGVRSPESKLPFNEVAVLFPLLTFYTVVYLSLIKDKGRTIRRGGGRAIGCLRHNRLSPAIRAGTEGDDPPAGE